MNNLTVNELAGLKLVSVIASSTIADKTKTIQVRNTIEQNGKITSMYEVIYNDEYVAYSGKGIVAAINVYNELFT